MTSAKIKSSTTILEALKEQETRHIFEDFGTRMMKQLNTFYANVKQLREKFVFFGCELFIRQ